VRYRSIRVRRDCAHPNANFNSDSERNTNSDFEPNANFNSDFNSDSNPYADSDTGAPRDHDYR
jgi:hypothetical protein